MDVMLLRVFQRQLLLQCNAFLIAWHDLQEALHKHESMRAWIDIEASLNAAASISRALWGLRKGKTAERKELRDSLLISDDSPLLAVTMRDNFVHFDERLDRWWDQSKRHNILDRNFGNVRQASRGFEEIEILRAFDPDTGEVMFWGQDFNLRAIANEISRILPKIVEEASRPHWETPR